MCLAHFQSNNDEAKQSIKGQVFQGKAGRFSDVKNARFKRWIIYGRQGLAVALQRHVPHFFLQL